MITQQQVIDLGFYDLETEYCDSYELGNLLIEFIPDGSVSLRVSSNEGTAVINNPKLYEVEYLIPEL